MNGKEAKQAGPPLQDCSLPSVASSSGVGGLCPLSCRTANGLVHAQKCPAGSHSTQVTSSGAAPSLRRAPHPFPLLLASGRWRTAASQSRAGRPVTHPSPTPPVTALYANTPVLCICPLLKGEFHESRNQAFLLVYISRGLAQELVCPLHSRNIS